MIEFEEVKSGIEKLNNANAQFKDRIESKINSLSDEMLEVMKKANRPNMSGGYSEQNALAESKSALVEFLRSRGETETKNMFAGSNPDGGWVSNSVLAEGIGEIARNASALRQLVSFVQLESGDSYDELLSVTPAGASWVSESEARPTTTTPKLVKINTPLHELYSNPTLSQRLVDDGSTNLVEYLINEVGTSFREAEDISLMTGTGINQPLGLANLTTVSTDDSSRAFGQIQYIPSGASGDFAATSPFDPIKRLYYSLKAGYRSDAVWVCNSQTALKLSEMKDSVTRYLWEDQVRAGDPGTLLGRPVIICENTPTLASNSLSLWFGNFQIGLRAVERPGNRILIDKLTNKPHMMVYVYRRIGLGLRDSNAIKVMKFASS